MDAPWSKVLHFLQNVPLNTATSNPSISTSTTASAASANKRNEIALAKVSLTIVLIFILCHSIKWIPNIYEVVRLSFKDKRDWPPWIESLTHIAHFAMSVNSSVNFYVYCFKHFRKCAFFRRNNEYQHSPLSRREALITMDGSSCHTKNNLVVDRPLLNSSNSLMYQQNGNTPMTCSTFV